MSFLVPPPGVDELLAESSGGGLQAVARLSQACFEFVLKSKPRHVELSRAVAALCGVSLCAWLCCYACAHLWLG